MFDFASKFSINRTDFYTNYRNTTISNVKTNQNKSYLYIGACAGINSLIFSGISILKCKKGFQNKYISHLKNTISEFLKTPEGKYYLDAIDRNKVYNKHFNFITYYKTIKNNIKKLTEVCKKYPNILKGKNKKKLREISEQYPNIFDDIESLSRLQTILLNMKKIFLDIYSNFNNEYIDKSTKYCLKNTAIGGILGALAGFGLNIFLRDNNANK